MCLKKKKEKKKKVRHQEVAWCLRTSPTLAEEQVWIPAPHGDWLGSVTLVPGYLQASSVLRHTYNVHVYSQNTCTHKANRYKQLTKSTMLRKNVPQKS